MKNSFKYFKYNELEEAWDLLEVALKENKPGPQQNGKQQNGTANGHVVNGNKRKIEEEVQPEENGTKAKKKKVEEEAGDTQEETTEKFNWTEVIRSILLNKNNEIKLSKLKKKVFNRYKKFSGSEVNEKLESKFSKKLKKSKGFVVDNDKVKLIE